AFPAQRDDPEVGVVDVDVRVASLVEADDGAAVLEDVEPAQDGPAQASVGDLLALVPDAPGGVEAETDPPEPFDHLGGEPRLVRLGWLARSHAPKVPTARGWRRKGPCPALSRA